jgi:hypothetical protein
MCALASRHLVPVFLFLAGSQALGSAHIVGWGTNNDGQLEIPVGNDFVSIAAGWEYSLALSALARKFGDVFSLQAAVLSDCG